MKVVTICYEVKIPIKNHEITMESFVIFHNKYLYLDSAILLFKKTKIFIGTFLFHKKWH